LITVAALTATYRPEQLRVHIARALENGITKEELGELITHLASYSGWLTAATVAHDVFDRQKIASRRRSLNRAAHKLRSP
jgi:4-carboxymuconolactone decarboxylase